MLDLRLPAPSDFLARRRAAIDWKKWNRTPPLQGSCRWLVETCRAELDWAEIDWRRLGGEVVAAPGHGPHPAEAWRLPHERAAARLVNCHRHVEVETERLRTMLRRLPGQRAAAGDATQDETYRASWAAAAAGTEQDLRRYRARRAAAWHALRTTAAHYCRLRATLDRASPLPQHSEHVAA
jgi:hypothetical protein